MKKLLALAVASICFAAAAQQPSVSTANITFHVKIPSVLSAEEMTFGDRRVIYVKSNVKSYCIEYYDPQGRARPVTLNGKAAGRHCFGSKDINAAGGTSANSIRDQRHEVTLVDPAWWMLVREQP